jgi:hypothetical protein
MSFPKFGWVISTDKKFPTAALTKNNSGVDLSTTHVNKRRPILKLDETRHCRPNVAN